MKVVVYFFQEEPQMERSPVFPCHAAAQGTRSLLQGACLRGELVPIPADTERQIQGSCW